MRREHFAEKKEIADFLIIRKRKHTNTAAVAEAVTVRACQCVSVTFCKEKEKVQFFTIASKVKRHN